MVSFNLIVNAFSELILDFVFHMKMFHPELTGKLLLITVKINVTPTYPQPDRLVVYWGSARRALPQGPAYASHCSSPQP